MINYSGLKRISFPTQAPDPYTPFVQAVQGLAGRAPQMSADMQRQEANKYRRAALDRMVQGAGMQAPQMQQGMDGKQALGVLLASLFGRALGANPGEVNDFVAGFTQARQNQASQANEQKMREFEMQQRQNQVLSQVDLGYADIANDEANRLQGYIDRDRASTDAMKAKQDDRNWWQQQQDARDASEAKKQAAMTERALIRDPAKVELYKAAGKRPEGRAWLARISGYDTDAEEALRQLDADELLKQAKTETENAMRPARLKKMDADIQKVLGGIALDESRKAQIDQKIAMYPDEYKLRAANVYSMIAKRESGGGSGKAEKYPGEGSETTFRQMRDISAKVIAPLTTKMMNGEQLTPEEAQMYAHHSAELKRFQDMLDKTIQAKANYHTSKVGGGDTGGERVYGKDTGWHKGVAEWVKSQGFEPSAGFNPGRHNKGSQHDYGDALDVRIGGKTPAQIEAFMKEALRMGWSVRDERTRPAGQKVWGGPHIHLSRPQDGVPKRTGGNTAVPKNDTTQSKTSGNKLNITVNPNTTIIGARKKSK